MKTVVVYKSKTGFTKRYAEWIAEELKADLVDEKLFQRSAIASYDRIIYGGSFEAGKVQGLRKIKAMFDGNTISKLVVFATGATPATAQDVIESEWKGNFTAEELGRIPHFYMQAGLNYEKMGAGDRMLMKAFAKMLGSKKNKTAEEEGTVKAIQNSYDISSREYIKPLIECCGGKA
ncbi:MAG: hypothetical protein E7256_03160 [Lachnospiraceae bacterium]|nr:hypothetical protein [Lachnospiraceae bacterium]